MHHLRVSFAVTLVEQSQHLFLELLTIPVDILANLCEDLSIAVITARR